MLVLPSLPVGKVLVITYPVETLILSLIQMVRESSTLASGSFLQLRKSRLKSASGAAGFLKLLKNLKHKQRHWYK